MYAVRSSAAVRSEDLAREVQYFALEASDRISGVGDKQYSLGDVQKFELKTPQQVLQDLREELLDGVVYLTQIWLRVSDALDAVSSPGVPDGGHNDDWKPGHWYDRTRSYTQNGRGPLVETNRVRREQQLGVGDCEQGS